MKRLLLALVLVAACSSGTVPSIDQVTGLTILAIKADPPDQLLVVDGGFFALLPDGGVPAGPAVTALAPATLTTLVADPTGNGRGIQVVFATCARLDGTTHQCLPTSTDYQVIGSGAYFPDAGPAIVAATVFTPSQQLLGDALALDPLHGFSYLPLPVQVTVNAGADEVVGVKTLTFSRPISIEVGVLGGPNVDGGVVALQPADMNPVMPEVTLDGTPWLSDGGPATIQNGSTVEPLPQTSELPYFVPEFDGGLIPFVDYWGFEFYCTAGSFSSPRSGGAPVPGFSFGLGRRDAGSSPINDAGETLPGTSVEWREDAGTPSQLVFYWVVVLDGRGGVDFTQRSARFEPF